MSVHLVVESGNVNLTPKLEYTIYIEQREITEGIILQITNRIQIVLDTDIQSRLPQSFLAISVHSYLHGLPSRIW